MLIIWACKGYEATSNFPQIFFPQIFKQSLYGVLKIENEDYNQIVPLKSTAHTSKELEKPPKKYNSADQSYVASASFYTVENWTIYYISCYIQSDSEFFICQRHEQLWEKRGHLIEFLPWCNKHFIISKN